MSHLFADTLTVLTYFLSLSFGTNKKCFYLFYYYVFGTGFCVPGKEIKALKQNTKQEKNVVNVELQK